MYANKLGPLGVNILADGIMHTSSLHAVEYAIFEIVVSSMVVTNVLFKLKKIYIVLYIMSLNHTGRKHC